MTDETAADDMPYITMSTNWVGIHSRVSEADEGKVRNGIQREHILLQQDECRNVFIQ
jgi:hypothetical protein